MKLLFCDVCWDIFKLDTAKRSCKCGRVVGKYLENEHNAVTNGNGVNIAIGNGSLQNAIFAMKQAVYVESEEVKDKHYFIRAAKMDNVWVRPHEGLGNPRSKVVPEEEI